MSRASEHAGIAHGSAAQASTIFAQVKQTIAAQRQAVAQPQASPREDQQGQLTLEQADLLLAQVSLQQSALDTAHGVTVGMAACRLAVCPITDAA